MAFVLLKTIIKLSKRYCFKMGVMCATTDSQNLIILLSCCLAEFLHRMVKAVSLSGTRIFEPFFLFITLSGTSGQRVPLRTSCTNSSSPLLQKE